MAIRPHVVLDIGSTKVACAVGLPNEHSPGFELLGTSLAPYPANPGAELSDPVIIGQTIEQALEATGVSADMSRAFVVFTHSAIESLRVPVILPLADEPVPVRQRDLDRLEQAALHQALAIDRDGLMVERLGCSGNGFNMVREPLGLAATRLHGIFHVVTMPVSVRRALVQAVESTGMEVAGLRYGLPSVFAAIADESMYHKRVVVIDVGGLTADIGLFIDGVLHGARVVRWGGAVLAEAIARECNVTLEQATTWTLEGTAGRTEEARELIQSSWQVLEQAILELLNDQPLPDAVLVSGRAGLIDGFVEWVERTTKAPTTIGRSPRTQRFGNLARQVGLNAVIGMLEQKTRTKASFVSSQHAVSKVLNRTKAILAEYF